MSNHMHKSNSATRLAAARRRMCAPLLLAALVAPAALADSRADAKRRFREGMALIAAGQVERGIAELKQAYAIKPHPALLYNIARAYVDLGKIPDALDYFQRYVATDPDDRAQVEAVMTRLSGAVGARAPPAQPAAAPAAVTAQTRATAQEIASALEGGHTDEDIFEEQVVTAGVHASSEARAPASLTVITADEIRLTG